MPGSSRSPRDGSILSLFSRNSSATNYDVSEILQNFDRYKALSDDHKCQIFTAFNNNLSKNPDLCIQWVEELKDRGLLNLRDENGQSIIYHALSNSEVAKTILRSHFADINFHSQDDNGDTLQDFAVKKGKKDLVNFIELHGGVRNNTRPTSKNNKQCCNIC